MIRRLPEAERPLAGQPHGCVYEFTPIPSAIGGLDLCETIIHKQFRPRDVAAVVGREKHDGFRDLIGCAEPAKRNDAGNHLPALRARFRSKSLNPGVSIDPGLTALTPMRRSFRSVVHVRANERTAAFVAL
jgi:hypothetical protein